MIIWIGWNGLALEIFHHKELVSAFSTRLFFLAFCCQITLFIKVAVFIYKKNPYHVQHHNVLKVLSCWRSVSRRVCG